MKKIIAIILFGTFIVTIANAQQFNNGDFSLSVIADPASFTSPVNCPAFTTSWRMGSGNGLDNPQITITHALIQFLQEHNVAMLTCDCRHMPQSLLLPLCSVVVSHAGSGTLSGAMSIGLPQLCLPQGADQFRNADALVKCGAGISLEGDDVTESSLANAIQRLLDESSFRRNAEKLQREVREMPTPDEMMAKLEAM